MELGLKRDALGAVDGSSLEALLKGEPLERRGGLSDHRGPEDDQAVAEPAAAASASTHTSSGRIRKVRLLESQLGLTWLDWSFMPGSVGCKLLCFHL